MAMESDNDDIEVSFEKVRVTPRHIFGVGPSGWAETFDRKKLENKLVAFTQPISVEDLLEVFRLSRKARPADFRMNWHTMRGFLARHLNHSPKLIPPEITLAFWAATILDQLQQAAN